MSDDIKISLPSLDFILGEVKILLKSSANTLLYLFKDTLQVNRNLFSKNSLSHNVNHYKESGFDLFALSITILFSFPFYLVWRIIKDTLISMHIEITDAIYDTFFLNLEKSDSQDNRHWTEKCVGGLGFLLGKALKTLIYLGALLGFSAFTYHHITLALKNCRQFISGTKFNTQPNEDALKKTRSWAASLIKHISLAQVFSTLIYLTTAGLALLGLTAHSFQASAAVINTVNQLAFGKNAFQFDYDKDAFQKIKPFSKEGLARAGLIGLVFMTLSAALIVTVKSLDITRRLIGFSTYARHTITLALKKSANFVFDSEIELGVHTKYKAAHVENDKQNFTTRADRSWIGLHRLFNGLTYLMTFALATLGLSIHSFRASAAVINKISQLAFGGNAFQFDYNKDAFQTIKTFSKEGFARAGLLGLVFMTLSAALIVTVGACVLCWL